MIHWASVTRSRDLLQNLGIFGSISASFFKGIYKNRIWVFKPFKLLDMDKWIHRLLINILTKTLFRKRLFYVV